MSKEIEEKDNFVYFLFRFCFKSKYNTNQVQIHGNKNTRQSNFKMLPAKQIYLHLYSDFFLLT